MSDHIPHPSGSTPHPAHPSSVYVCCSFEVVVTGKKKEIITKRCFTVSEFQVIMTEKKL